MGTQQFSLKWNSHQSNMLTVFGQLLSSEVLVDVTLACEGLSIKAHKMVLSACSPFFQSLFVENPCTHPIVIMNDMKYANLKAIVDFMYRGEVNVTEDQFGALLKTAETLKVKGLAEVTGVNLQEVEKSQTVGEHDNNTQQNILLGSHASCVADVLPATKKKRDRRQRRHSSSSNISDGEYRSPKQNQSSNAEPRRTIKAENTQINSCHAVALPSYPQNISSIHSIQKTLPSLHPNVSPQWNQESLTDESFSNDRNYEVEPLGITRQINDAKNTRLSDNQEQSPPFYPLPQVVASGTLALADRQSDQMDTIVSDNHVLIQHSETSMSSCILPNNNQDNRLDDLQEESSVLSVAGPSSDGNHSLANTDTPVLPSVSDSNIELSGAVKQETSVSKSEGNKNTDTADTSNLSYGVCPICNRSFKSTYLPQHLFLHSSQPLKYSCRICHREFTRHQSLLRHCRTVHASSKKFFMSNDKYCTICDKVFTNNQNYKVHMMKHRPEEDISISNTAEFIIAR